MAIQQFQLGCSFGVLIKFTQLLPQGKSTCTFQFFCSILSARPGRKSYYHSLSKRLIISTNYYFAMLPCWIINVLLAITPPITYLTLLQYSLISSTIYLRSDSTVHNQQTIQTPNIHHPAFSIFLYSVLAVMPAKKTRFLIHHQGI